LHANCTCRSVFKQADQRRRDDTATAAPRQYASGEVAAGDLYREHEQKVAEWRDQPKSALGDRVAEAKRSLEVSDARRREIESALKLIRARDPRPWRPTAVAARRAGTPR
jgi:hypothetical protein